MTKAEAWFKLLLYVHINRKAHWDGKPRTASLTFTQLLKSVVPLELAQWVAHRELDERSWSQGPGPVTHRTDVLPAACGRVAASHVIAWTTPGKNVYMRCGSQKAD